MVLGEPPLKTREALVIRTIRELGGVARVDEIGQYLSQHSRYRWSRRLIEKLVFDLVWSEHLRELDDCVAVATAADQKFLVTALGTESLAAMQAHYKQMVQYLDGRGATLRRP